MTTPKFTPGLWHISTDVRGDEICTIHGVPSQPTEDGEGQRWIYVHYERVVNGDWYWPSEAEKLANARLIAAAPECYKKIGHLMAWLEAALSCPDWVWDCDQRDAAEFELAECRALLAKINGGDHA